MNKKIEHQHPTKCICHKELNRYSRVVACSNFRVGGQETAPQSLTAHTLARYRSGYDDSYQHYKH